MKNPYIIPAAMICAAILAGFWMLKSPSEPQEVIVVKPPQRPVQRPVVPIHYAAIKGNIEAIMQHLVAGTDVNAKSEGGSTPLGFAAFYGYYEIVEVLIAAGADVNAKNDDGKTPLDWAIDFKHTETADLLRKHGGKTGEELKAEDK